MGFLKEMIFQGSPGRGFREVLDAFMRGGDNSAIKTSYNYYTGIWVFHLARLIKETCMGSKKK